MHHPGASLQHVYRAQVCLSLLPVGAWTVQAARVWLQVQHRHSLTVRHDCTALINAADQNYCQCCRGMHCLVDWLKGFEVVHVQGELG